MRSLVLLLMLILPIYGFGQDIRVRPNVFGGFNYTENGKLVVSSRKNLRGGYTYQGKVNGYTRKTIGGGYQFVPFSNKSSLNNFTPFYKGK